MKSYKERSVIKVQRILIGDGFTLKSIFDVSEYMMKKLRRK